MGKTMRFLCERVSERPGYMQGRLAIQAPEIDGLTYLKVTQQIPSSGDFLNVKICKAEEYDLQAEIVS